MSRISRRTGPRGIVRHDYSYVSIDTDDDADSNEIVEKRSIESTKWINKKILKKGEQRSK